MKYNLILPKELKGRSPRGVLDTEEKVRSAREELEKATEKSFEIFRKAKLEALKEAATRFLD
jgi:hypothetical protein